MPPRLGLPEAFSSPGFGDGGGVSRAAKGADCKSAGYAFVGSSPTSPTIKRLILLLFQQSAPFAASRGFVAGNLRIRSLSGSFRAPVAVFGAPPLTAVFVCFRGGSKTPRQRLWFETTESGPGQRNLTRARRPRPQPSSLEPIISAPDDRRDDSSGAMRWRSRIATGVILRRYVRPKAAPKD